MPEDTQVSVWEELGMCRGVGVGVRIWQEVQVGAGSPLWWLKSQYRWNPCAWAGGSDSVPGALLVCGG